MPTLGIEKEGKVLQFPQNRIHEEVSISSSSSLELFVFTDKERTRKRHSQIQSRGRLDEAFFKIVDATNHDLELVERSNYFDEWKDLLELSAKKIEALDIEHRQILGALILATHQKDVADFNSGSLHILQEVTNVLRQPRITNLDAERAFDVLLKQGFQITLPLAVDDLNEDNVKSLEDMMAKLLEKSCADR